MTEHYTMAAPTPQLRWLVEPVTSTKPRRLQQWWAITSYDEKHAALGVHGEWRDVPTEIDEYQPDSR